MKLNYEQLLELYIEMIETEEINSESEVYARMCEHEDAGDRI